MAGSIEAVQKILQETIAPGIGDIRERLARVEGEMTGLKVEIKRLDEKVDNGFARMDERFLRQAERMDHLEDKIHTALEIRERLAALEARIGR